MGNKRRFRNAAGPQIRRIRDAKELTQGGLAVQVQLFGLDMDRTAIAKIESQLRSLFDYELAIFARALGVAAEELLPKDGELKRALPDLMAGEKESTRSQKVNVRVPARATIRRAGKSA